LSPKGYDDQKSILVKKSFFPVQDIGELAARLGAPPSLNRSGEWFFYDSFEEGLGKWDVNISPGRTVTLEVGFARSGGYCAKIVGDSTVASVDGALQRWFQFFDLSLWACEFSIYLEDLDAIVSSALYGEWENYSYEGNIRIDFNTGKVYFYDFETSAWKEVWTIPFTLVTNQWYTIKYAIDPENETYKYIYFGGKRFDYTAAKLDKNAWSAGAAMVGFDLYRQFAGSTTIYLDDVIITQEEV